MQVSQADSPLATHPGDVIMKRNSVRLISVVLVLLLFPALAAAAEPQRLSRDAFSFGLATQTDGEIMVIGAPDEDVAGSSRQGAAYVYEHRGGAWQEVARLTASDGDALDRFGFAIAVDENVVLVAAPHAAVNTVPEAGAVYVFERNAEGRWTETEKVVAEDASTMAAFGSSLALDGEMMIVAAPGAPRELEAYSGAAYLFDYDAGAQSWQQTERIARGDNFATDVDVSGDSVAIAMGNEQGFVYTYRYDGSDWVFEIPVQPAEGRDNKVALENDVLVVGTPGDVLLNRPWSNVGGVHVFERGTSGWQHVAEFHQEFPGPLGMFGDYLDMNDGLIAAAGSGENSGGVSLIRKNETGEWVQAFPGLGVVEFGGSLAVSARALAAGGPSGEGGNIYVLEMAELLPGEMGNDEPADDPGDGDDDGGDNGAGDNDDANNADDSSNGAGADDEGMNDDSGATGSDTGGDSSGNNEPPGSADSGDDSGGGSPGWLFAVLGIFAGLLRRNGSGSC